MANIPLSDVTIIAAVLGVFFLIVAFYKSIFHKRRSQTQTAVKPAVTVAAPLTNQTIKLADPFQQVPVDHLSLASKPLQPGPIPYYPTFPQTASAPVSAFRQFNPRKEFETAASPQKNETTYEWE